MTELALGRERGTAPHRVRNFWLSGRVDGIETPIGTGPKGTDGGFELTVLMRGPNGGVHAALTLLGTATDDGKNIQLTVLDGRGDRAARLGPVATGR